jgi:hypothetical protein
MNTLKIIIKSTGAVAEWEIVGEMPTMNTVRPTPCEGGFEVAIEGHELKSGGILHHLRQQGHFRALDLTF